MKRILFISFFAVFYVAGTVYAETITFSDFSDPRPLTLNGSATITNYMLRLTQPSNDQASSAFLTNPISLGPDGSFNTKFVFQETASSGYGGEGIVFVIQNVSPSAIGGTGQNIGYSGITPSVGIEFDTNVGTGGMSPDHVGINLNGSLTSVTALDVSSRTYFSNTGPWYIWIDYVNGFLEVRFDTTDTRPDTPFISYWYPGLTSDLDIENVYVGFTSAGGNTHDILSWEFTYEGSSQNQPCECDLNNDGRCDMRDWLIFGQDWGRTDCPVQ